MNIAVNIQTLNLCKTARTLQNSHNKTRSTPMKNRLRWTRWIALALCVSSPHFLATPALQWIGALMCLVVGARADFLALHGD